MNRIRVAIRTVGCRANQADSGALVRGLDPASTQIVESLSEADLLVINTCCVTAEAERDCRKLARKTLRESPEAKVVFTGCAVTAVKNFGEGIGDRVFTIGGGDVPPREIARLLQINVGAPIDSSEGDVPNDFRAQHAAPLRRDMDGRTRALLKIQNGCNYNCAYCIVPLARGSETSMPAAEVLENVRRIQDEGFKELVLTGVQIGAWGKDLAEKPRLPGLIEMIADSFTPGRIRLSSIEPWSVDDALIEVVAGHDRVCPHLHVPLQSGDDRILQAMGRGYTAAQFSQIVQKAVSASPDLSFGTDVICGFPAEDEAAFENTLTLLCDIPLAYVHAFPYSERIGTRAASMEPKSDRAVSKERVRRVRALGEEAEARFRKSQIGKVREVIIESADGDTAKGLTDNYLQVATQGTQGGLMSARLVPGKGERQLSAIPCTSQGQQDDC